MQLFTHSSSRVGPSHPPRLYLLPSPSHAAAAATMLAALRGSSALLRIAIPCRQAGALEGFLVTHRPSRATTACWAAMSSAEAASKAEGASGKSVAVVGGGIAGAVCALKLGQRGFHVTLVDMGKQSPGGNGNVLHCGLDGWAEGP